MSDFSLGLICMQGHCAFSGWPNHLPQFAKISMTYNILLSLDCNHHSKTYLTCLVTMNSKMAYMSGENTNTIYY